MTVMIVVTGALHDDKIDQMIQHRCGNVEHPILASAIPKTANQETLGTAIMPVGRGERSDYPMKRIRGKGGEGRDVGSESALLPVKREVDSVGSTVPCLPPPHPLG